MNCIYSSKKSCNLQCKYCIYPDGYTYDSREHQVKKLQKIRTILVKKLMNIEKQLLNPTKKGGDKYASI